MLGRITLDENCLALLDRMIELGKGPEVHISITTNGTNARQSFLDRIKHLIQTYVLVLTDMALIMNM